MSETAKSLSILSNDLRKSSDICKSVNPGIRNIHSKLNIVQKSLVSVKKIPGHIGELTKSVNTLKLAANGISFIPIVGTVASQISKILSTAKVVLNTAKVEAKACSSCIKLVESAIKEVDNALKLLDTSTSYAVEHFNSYADAVDILESFIQFIDAVDKLLPNSPIHTRIEALKTDFSKQISSLNSLLAIVKSSSHEIEQAAHAIISEISELKKKLSFADQIINLLGKAYNAVSPVGNAIAAILSKIKPVAYLLKAISWIFNIIVKPVINSILKITGLSVLIDKLEDFLCKQLKLDKLKDEITTPISKFHDSLRDKIKSPLDLFTGKLDDVSKQLNAFCSLDFLSNNLVQFIDESVEAFYNQEFDPDLPEFKFNGILKNKSIVTDVMEHYNFLSDYKYSPVRSQFLSVATNDSDKFLLKVPKSNSRDNLVLSNAELQPRIDTNLNNLKALVDYVNQLKGKHNRIKICYDYLNSAKSELDIYKTIMVSINHLFKLLDEYPIDESRLVHLKYCIDLITNEINSCDNVYKKIENTKLSLDDIFTKVNQFEAHIPIQADIDSLYNDLESLIDNYEKVENTLCSWSDFLESAQKSSGNENQNINLLLAGLNNKQHKLNDDKKVVLKNLDIFETTINQILELFKELSDISGNLEPAFTAIFTDQCFIDDKIFTHGMKLSISLDKVSAVVAPFKNLIIAIKEVKRDDVQKFILLINKYLGSFLDIVPFGFELAADAISPRLVAQSLDQKLKESTLKIEDLKNRLISYNPSEIESSMETMKTSLQGSLTYTLYDEIYHDNYIDDEFVSISTKFQKLSRADESLLKQRRIYILKRVKDITCSRLPETQGQIKIELDTEIDLCLGMLDVILIYSIGSDIEENIKNLISDFNKLGDENIVADNKTLKLTSDNNIAFLKTLLGDFAAMLTSISERSSSYDSIMDADTKHKFSKIKDFYKEVTKLDT